MPPFRRKSIHLQPYFGHRSANRLRLTARALRQGERSFEPRSRLGAMRTLLGQFTSSEVAGLKVTLSIQGPDGTLLDADGVTDEEGFVHFDLALEPEWDLPEHPAWERAELVWNESATPSRIEALVLAPGLDSRLAVISDIDDTIIETGITGGWKSLARTWRRIFTQLPGERKIVPGAGLFYGALGGGEVPISPLEPGERRAERRIAATHRPFFYVSSSPWNLFSYLVAYQRAHGLPLGPLLLRDWGMNRATFGKASHGHHKRDAIAAILAMYPDLDFALIGDDTQGDLPAFAGAVSAYPGRVAAVFVRTVGKALTLEEEQAIAAIRTSGVPLWLGSSFAVGEEFLRALGFTPGGETEQIVKVVEKVETPPQ